MIEVAFDDPDNTSLFLSSSDIQLLSVKFDQQALLSFRPVFSFSFFYFFFIYIYIYIYIYKYIIFLFSPYDHGGTYHCVDFITYNAVGTMPLVQIRRDSSTALVILDSAGMNTIVPV